MDGLKIALEAPSEQGFAELVAAVGLVRPPAGLLSSAVLEARPGWSSWPEIFASGAWPLMGRARSAGDMVNGVVGDWQAFELATTDPALVAEFFDVAGVAYDGDNLVVGVDVVAVHAPGSVQKLGDGVNAGWLYDLTIARRLVAQLKRRVGWPDNRRERPSRSRSGETVAYWGVDVPAGEIMFHSLPGDEANAVRAPESPRVVW